ncbi:MAG: hypothetical protein IID14_08545, partial [Candidatus Marinimicrobia bacterium]|nr:hypothetical protein [Candidatus Neomarinimicrobiota bacterium]
MPKADADRELVRYQALEDLAKGGHPIPASQQPPLHLVGAVEEYFRSRKRLAPNTIRKYRQALGRFGDQIGPMFNLHQLRRQ